MIKTLSSLSALVLFLVEACLVSAIFEFRNYFGEKMAVRSVSLIKKSIDSVAKTSVGTSYDTSKKASLDLAMPDGFPFAFHLEGIFVQMSSISSATKLTVKLTSDSGGDEALVTSTESTIDVGVTTSSDGTAIYKVDLDYIFDDSPVYLMMKTDAGTVTVDSVTLTYHE
jgi:hypothetical protein